MSASTLRRLFDSLRPFGGRLLLRKDLASKVDLDQWIGDWGEPGVKLSEQGAHLVLTREGALAGSGNWTHEHGDAANTRVSKDSIVRAPLGLLWFGGPSHEGILPRHGHGPQPQVLDGRLIIEGIDMIRATDIYTGRLLWETSLPGVGDFFNNTIHQPGANASGSNLVSSSDGIYVAWKKKCVRLDPATGKILSEFKIPGGGDSDWTCLSLSGDYLVGGSEPTVDLPIAKKTTGGFDDPNAPLDAAIKALLSFKADNDSRCASGTLFVLDRSSGELRWKTKARAGFRHNSICMGGGKLFVIDRQSGPEIERLKKRGDPTRFRPLLLAFDLKTGRELWRSEEDIFGTFLSYSEARDVLVEAGRVARDTINDEPKDKMRAGNAAEGKVMWRKNYSGPGMIHGDTIIAGEKGACDLLTGAPRGRIHPWTLQPVEWTWARNYGCNTPAASEHLLTFRSGAAGYFDLANDGGTGNLGGFKSGCTNNLIVAGGLLNAPDYTRTCICSYQNQTSLALVAMPEAEMWTFFGSTEVKGPIKRIGVNFGAPGDRRAEDGTLWVEHPSVGGKSPTAPVALDGPVEYFRRHSSRISGAGIPWVSASGVKGIRSLTLMLNKDAKAEQPYLVRLHFVEPDGLKPEQRLFDVEMQGKEVLKDFDIVKEAGGGDRALVKEFTVDAGRDLKLKFIPRRSAPLLCGIEAIQGGQLSATPMPAKNVVHSDLTVPEPPSLPKPAEEASVDPQDATLKGFLWILLGAVVFGWIVFRLGAAKGRAAA
jgi:outer membrane protein assembly factor BamB